MSTYTSETNKVSSCCNLVLWDFLFTTLIFFTIAQDYFTNLSGFQHFLIGLATGFLLLALMNIKFLRIIITILYSALWARFAYEILIEIFHISQYSPQWRYGIGIFCFIVTYSIHMMSADDFGFTSFSKFSSSQSRPKSEFNSSYPNDSHMEEQMQLLRENLDYCNSLYSKAMELTKQADVQNNAVVKDFIGQHSSQIVKSYNKLTHVINKFNKNNTPNTFNHTASQIEAVVKELDFYINYLQYYANSSTSGSSNNQEQWKEDANSQNKTSNEANYFKGCDTIEKLNKRYHDLVKIYHTDSGNGNDQTFIEITDEYNSLKKQFAN